MTTMIGKKREDELKKFWEGNYVIFIDVAYGIEVQTAELTKRTQDYSWDEFKQLCSDNGLPKDDFGYKVELINQDGG